MPREKHSGFCHCCGKKGPLTFEHVPPKATGNTHTAKLFDTTELIRKNGYAPIENLDGFKYKQQQRGTGRHSYCSSCNSYFGSHYVNEYTKVAQTFISYLHQHQFEPKVKGVCGTLHDIQVLPFFKHIITMFCATTQTGSMEDCAPFLLDKNSTAFPTGKYKLVMRLLRAPANVVFTGWSAQIATNGIITLAACQTYPFAFMLYNLENTTAPADHFGCDITGLGQFSYDAKPHCTLQLPLLAGNIIPLI